MILIPKSRTLGKTVDIVPGDVDSKSSKVNQTFVFAEELKSKDNLIKILSAKVSRTSISFDELKSWHHDLKNHSKNLEEQLLESKEISSDLEQKLRNCFDIISELSDRCEAQCQDISDLKIDLARSLSQPPQILARLEEESERSKHFEAALNAQFSIMNDWLFAHNLPQTVEPCASLLVSRIQELEESIVAKEETEKSLVKFIHNLQEEIATEQEWRHEVQKTIPVTEKNLLAAQARSKNLSIQLEHARSEMLAATSKARQLQEALNDKNNEVLAKKEELKQKKHKIVTNRLASNKAYEDKIANLEKQLKDLKEEAEQKVSMVKAEMSRQLEKAKKRNVQLSTQCYELERCCYEQSNVSAALSTPLKQDPVLNNKDAPAWMNFNVDLN